MTRPLVWEGLSMEYVYIIGGIFILCLMAFFRYLLLHCSHTYHPTVPMMRSASLTHNLHHMVPSASFPYSISGTISTFDHTCVTSTTTTTAATASSSSTAANDSGPYGPVYTLPPPPSSLRSPRPAPVPRRTATLGGPTPLQARHLSRFRRGARTMWTSHGPPDYETVMAGRANPAFIFEQGDSDSNLPTRTPPPSYESVIESMEGSSGPRPIH